jgi:hypothetical protein
MLCLLVGTERRAWGYIDPGSGLVALQTLASVAAAYAYVVRRRIRALFTGKESVRKETQEKPPVLPMAVKVDSREAA